MLKHENLKDYKEDNLRELLRATFIKVELTNNALDNITSKANTLFSVQVAAFLIILVEILFRSPVLRYDALHLVVWALCFLLSIASLVFLLRIIYPNTKFSEGGMHYKEYGKYASEKDSKHFLLTMIETANKGVRINRDSLAENRRFYKYALMFFSASAFFIIINLFCIYV